MAKRNAKVRKYAREWARKRRKQSGAKEKERNIQKKYRNRLRDAIFALLGSVCIYCGFSDQRALHIDHINGSGNKEKKELGGHNAMLRKILATAGVGYQILCANCNNIKKIENKEFPYAKS